MTEQLEAIGLAAHRLAEIRTELDQWCLERDQAQSEADRIGAIYEACHKEFLRLVGDLVETAKSNLINL